MSSSHLFLGLPVALLVLYLEHRSGFHSAAFLIHLSLGEVAILSANFHFIFLYVLFQQRIFPRSILSNASVEFENEKEIAAEWLGSGIVCLLSLVLHKTEQPLKRDRRLERPRRKKVRPHTELA